MKTPNADLTTEHTACIPRHTPGPWVLTVTGVRCEVRTSPESVYAFTLKDEANARLIASAPQLLEALEALLFDYNAKLDAYNDYRISADGMPPVKEDASATAARAAIAKAKGETK